MGKRSISITGEATCYMKPDMCTISFVSRKYNEDYSQCLKELNEEVSEIINRLKEIKIDEESLTTRDFDIRDHKVYDENLKKYIFVEYVGEHKVDIKIDNDNDLINKILNMLNSHEFTPRITISFGLKDEKIIKEEALKMAIEKAKKNAEIIVMGLGVKLGDVLNVNYNYEGVGISSRGYDCLEEMQICKASENFNIMPEDTSYSESVSVVWEIK